VECSGAGRSREVDGLLTEQSSIRVNAHGRSVVAELAELVDGGRDDAILRVGLAPPGPAALAVISLSGTSYVGPTWGGAAVAATIVVYCI
jgi:hypothetical protein